MQTFANSNGAELSRGRRVATWIPQKTFRQIESKRGYYSRSQFIEIAIDKFLAEIKEENNDINGVTGSTVGRPGSPNNTTTSTKTPLDSEALVNG